MLKAVAPCTSAAAARPASRGAPRARGHTVVQVRVIRFAAPGCCLGGGGGMAPPPPPTHASLAQGGPPAVSLGSNNNALCMSLQAQQGTSVVEQAEQKQELQLVGPEPQRFVVAKGQLKEIASAAFPALMRLGSGAFTSGYSGEPCGRCSYIAPASITCGHPSASSSPAVAHAAIAACVQ